jgi:tetratricopeptide (TPR) repeat protein
LGKNEDALKIFQRLLVLATNSSEKARAYLWIGKCYQALDKTDDAKNAFTAGEQAAPTDYYGIRSVSYWMEAACSISLNRSTWVTTWITNAPKANPGCAAPSTSPLTPISPVWVI